MQTLKIVSLLDYLNKEQGQTIIEQDLEICSDTIIKIDDWDYMILDNQEREKTFKQYQKELWEDMGLGAFTTEFAQTILNSFIDKEKLDKLEKNEFNHDEAEYTMAEAFGYENYLQYAYKELGLQEATKLIDKHDLLRFDALCTEIAKIDGYGLTLAHYDGQERELDNDFYAYLMG